MRTLLDSLAIRAGNGDESAFEALVAAMGDRPRLVCVPYYLPGADREDLEQRAVWGLWKACQDWEPEKSSFASFATLCMQREVITAVKTATRNKHAPLNLARWLDEPMGGDDEMTLRDLLPDHGADPLERLEAKERLHALFAAMKTMSDVERNALWLIEACDVSYDVAAAKLGVSEKTIDNALQRARRKLALLVPDGPTLCDICETEILVGTRCRACQESVDIGMRFLAA